MKKFMLAAAVACSAMFAQAASVAWGTEWVYDLSENDAVGSYFLVSLTGDSTEGIAVNKAGALVDANSFVKSTLMSGTFTDASTLAGSYDELAVADNGTYLALIVVDSDNAFYGISGAVVLNGIADDPPANADGITFTNYTSSWEESAMRMDTATIPEPTVLALLALGVAGLALKRKNA